MLGRCKKSREIQSDEKRRRENMDRGKKMPAPTSPKKRKKSVEQSNIREDGAPEDE